MATLAYLMLTVRGTPKMPCGFSSGKLAGIAMVIGTAVSHAHIPFGSSLRVLRLNWRHHEARSRLEGGEEGTTGGSAGWRDWNGSGPAGCDLPVTMLADDGGRAAESRKRERVRREKRVGEKASAKRHPRSPSPLTAREIPGLGTSRPGVEGPRTPSEGGTKGADGRLDGFDTRLHWNRGMEDEG